MPSFFGRLIYVHYTNLRDSRVHAKLWIKFAMQKTSKSANIGSSSRVNTRMVATTKSTQGHPSYLWPYPRSFKTNLMYFGVPEVKAKVTGGVRVSQKDLRDPSLLMGILKRKVNDQLSTMHIVLHRCTTIQMRWQHCRLSVFVVVSVSPNSSSIA